MLQGNQMLDSSAPEALDGDERAAPRAAAKEAAVRKSGCAVEEKPEA
jgi:hypothetical protein